MSRYVLSIIAAILWMVAGPAHAADPLLSGAGSAVSGFSGRGTIDAVDPQQSTIVINDHSFRLAAATRVMSASGQALSVAALRPGLVVGYVRASEDSADRVIGTIVVVAPR